MWHAEFPKRELIELCLGGFDPRRVRAYPTGQVAPPAYSSSFNAYWAEDPSATPGLPTLIVTPQGEAEQFLIALSASPQAPMPFTALCRVLERDEAAHLFGDSPPTPHETLVRVTAVLAIVEAILHSDGKFNLKSIGAAVCRRTLSYAWGKAAAANAPRSLLEPLVTRWFQTYSLMGHAPSSLASVTGTVDPLLEILPLIVGEDATSEVAGDRRQLLDAILFGGDMALSRVWRNLGSALGLRVTIDELAAASREERGSFLQQGLRVVARGESDSLAVVGCAFLATQVAPRSLEHLEILRTSGNAALVLWYAFLAAVQHPDAILSAQGGLGLRLLRDIKNVGEHVAAPSADIAFSELQIVSKLGWEAIARRSGHAAEVEVELIPRVSASFASPSRSIRSDAPERSTHEPPRHTGLDDVKRARIYDALNAIAKVIDETREELVLTSPQSPVKKSYRKKLP